MVSEWSWDFNINVSLKNGNTLTKSNNMRDMKNDNTLTPQKIDRHCQ